MALNDKQLQAVQLLVLDRWNPRQANNKIAKQLGVKPNTVHKWRKLPEFEARFKTELIRDRECFDELPLAWRKERVKALSDLYDKIDDERVSLKVKVLQAIREEVGDNRIQVDVNQEINVTGLNLPPRAESYEEWVKQNRQMEAVEAEFAEVVPAATPVSSEEAR